VISKQVTKCPEKVVKPLVSMISHSQKSCLSETGDLLIYRYTECGGPLRDD
jgi:hypothetical protein